MQFEEPSAAWLRDVELVKELLAFALPKNKCDAVADALFSTFGTLDGIFCATMPMLLRVEGVTESVAVLVRLIPDIYRRGKLEQDTAGMYVPNYQAAGQILCKYFWSLGTEAIVMLSVDSQRRFISCIQISEGNVSGSTIKRPDFMRHALYDNAAGIYLAHNHPNAVLRPSQTDLDMTEQVAKALAEIRVLLLDHLIISGNDFYSINKHRGDHSDTLL